jgi:hypothetical protein
MNEASNQAPANTDMNQSMGEQQLALLEGSVVVAVVMSAAGASVGASVATAGEGESHVFLHKLHVMSVSSINWNGDMNV